jgi:hypothetical protein
LFTDLKKIKLQGEVCLFMPSKNLPKNRDHQLVVQELNDEVLIFDLNTSKAYSLNETSAAIWDLCDGESSVSDITQKLSTKLKQPVPDEIVWLALDQFKKDDLLSNGKAIEINFNGLSRRQVIRKVGFASMIALPVINSLIAPTAGMAASGAASCRTVGQNCTGPGSGPCCTGTAYCSGNTCVACLASGFALGHCVGGGPPCPFVNNQCCSGFAVTQDCNPAPINGRVDIFNNPPPMISTYCGCG